MIVYDEPNKFVETESADEAGIQNENLSDNLEMEANPSYITGSLLNVRRLVRVDDNGVMNHLYLKDNQENSQL